VETQAGILCPTCGQGNRPDRRFCTECGTRLGRACASCGASAEPGEKFCGNCGASFPGATPSPPEPPPAAYTPRHLAEKILNSRAALEGERKQVTVLFADVKGSMELAEQVDPEEWHKILDRFFAILAEGVHRFEGTVNQYTGDGIMALFGAPIAHEDHAQRACWAALHLRDELRRYAEELRRTRGLGFSVRLGLNSGEVVVGRIGDDLRMDYTAQGHTVGLAARMEQLAAPDQAYLSDHTAALVAGFFRLRDLGLFTLKGVREPLRVHELEGIGPLRTRLDVSRARGFSRFVGRLDEMAALEAALARALEGDGQVVGVVADAGVGKSRLCFEFLERCRARGMVTYRASGVAHGKHVPFLPVLELLRDYYGITAADSAAIAREKIAGRLLLLDRALDDALPVAFDFLGVGDPERPVPPMEPEARQRQLFELLRRVIQLRGRREPTVTLLEDLHWFDSGSEAFLTPLVEARSGTRALLVVNLRPEYRADWMQKSYYQQLPLRPLGAEATDELLRELLGTDPTLAGLAAQIRARTGGNPFFIEEVVQSLVEAGALEGARGAYHLVGQVAKVAIPSNVQAVLAARIDRLPEREKQVLHTAAVIGREFTAPILRRVAELPEMDLAAALHALRASELVYEEALYPEAEYAFKHPLTQEVAYRSQLRERRARVHAAVARAIAELHPDRLDEWAALLAHHWEAAGEALEAARWSRRAAEWVGANDPAEALRHWRKVRALVKTVPESADTIGLAVTACIQALSFGWRLGAAEEAADLFTEGQALARQSGDLRSLAVLTNVYGAVRGMAGGMEEYLQHTIEAARLAEQSGDAAVKLAVAVDLINSHYLTGHLKQAVAFADAALAEPPKNLKLGSDLRGFSPYLVCMMLRGWSLIEVGRLSDAASDLACACELARAHGEVENLGWASGGYARLGRFTGDAENALENARRAVEGAEKIDSNFQRVWSYWALGTAYLVSEEWDEAAVAFERALAIARDTRAALWFEAGILPQLAEAHLGRGQLGPARATAEEAVRIARERSGRHFECEAHLALVRVVLATEGLTARHTIERTLGRALSLVGETGGKALEPFIRVELSNLARLAGDEATSQRELREAHRLLVEMGATARAKQVAKELTP
jgi:class 3 adenylate cyclase/tetratricopeptide (TPR) repeat protein